MSSTNPFQTDVNTDEQRAINQYMEKNSNQEQQQPPPQSNSIVSRLYNRMFSYVNICNPIYYLLLMIRSILNKQSSSLPTTNPPSCDCNDNGEDLDDTTSTHPSPLEPVHLSSLQSSSIQLAQKTNYQQQHHHHYQPHHSKEVADYLEVVKV